MDSIYLLNRGIWLLSLSVCFSIVLLSVQHPYQHQLVVRRARLYVVPLTIFVMNALHLTPGFSIELVYWLGESLFLILVIFAYWESARFLEKPVGALLFLPAVTAGLVWLLHAQAAQLMNEIPLVHYVWTILFPLVILYWHNKQKKIERRFFFYGTFILTLSYGVQFFGKSVYLPEVSVLLKITAYVLWTAHFALIARTETLTYKQDLIDLERKMDRTAFYAAKKRESEIARTHQNILETAKKDGLTGAFNRISIMDMIEETIRMKKEGAFSILMFDIDKFKYINDNFGHVVGDMALKQLANVADGVIRGEDRFGRYGGDEFIVLLPSLNLPEARIVAERLRERVSDIKDPSFTISIGIAIYPKDATSVTKLIEIADKGMYRSKGKGGNAVSHVDVF